MHTPGRTDRSDVTSGTLRTPPLALLNPHSHPARPLVLRATSPRHKSIPSALCVKLSNRAELARAHPSKNEINDQFSAGLPCPISSHPALSCIVPSSPKSNSQKSSNRPLPPYPPNINNCFFYFCPPRRVAAWMDHERHAQERERGGGAGGGETMKKAQQETGGGKRERGGRTGSAALSTLCTSHSPFVAVAAVAAAAALSAAVTESVPPSSAIVRHTPNHPRQKNSRQPRFAHGPHRELLPRCSPGAR